MNKGNTNTWRIAKRDVLPSFLVGPISLMFAVGIALVAHTPVESALIAIVIGGVITTAFGGAFINISGPGVHSAAVWMMGCLILGNGDFHNGFKWMLASSVVVGFLMVAVGATRQVHRLDIIPIAVRRAVVAMLGIWILIGQLPLLIGAYAYQSYSSLGEVLRTYPQVIQEAVVGDTTYWISGLGLIALVFMIFYSSYQNRLIRMIPAPIWLLAGGIGAAIYLNFNEGAAFVEQLNEQVQMKAHWLLWFHQPSFSKLATMPFWVVTLGLFVVTMHESVTNLRTTDRLDLQHRRSDVHREIFALGMATVASSLIGGMNVTATVAQSSTNAQLRAQTRFSNLNNTLVVVLLVALGSVFIEQLLVPAVAAMMVYIGYRIAAPSHLRAVAEIGWEDFVAFVVTFVVGWMFGIFYGILCGVAVIFALQLITSGKFGLILRFAFRPNTLLYQEDSNSYLLSIKHYGNFLNLARIREKIDSVPSSSEMTIDFSLAEFVDQNVLIQLEYYEEIFLRRGGRFEIVGIDSLPARVHHPFASWMPFGEAPSESGELSSRQESIAEWAEGKGFTYHPDVLYSGLHFYAFHYFRAVQIEGQRNRVSGTVAGMDFILADIDFHQGEFIARGTTHCTMMSLDIHTKIPQFILDRERLLDRVAAFAGFNDINFDHHPKFSSKFRLQGPNERAIRKFFTNEFVELLYENSEYHIEAKGDKVLIFEKERLAGANEMIGLVSFAEKLASYLKSNEE